MEAQEQPLQLTQIQMTKEPLDQTTILARTPTNRDEENHALEVIHTRTIEQARCIDCAGSLEDTDKRQDSKHESHVEAEKNIVDWDGPDDPENPKNMTEARKWAIVGATGAMTFCVSFSSSVFSTTVFQTAAEFHVSTEVMLLGVSLYVLGFAFGPLIWGPMSELYGRTRPLFFGMFAFCVFQIPVAVAHNLETIFICRFLAGLFGSAPLAIIAGIYVDFMEPVQRGTATGLFSAAVFVGPVAGPIVGSFITQSYLGWRWTAWITLIMSAFFSTIAFIVTPETFDPILLRQKAHRLRTETGNWALHARSEEGTNHNLVSNYLTKPLRMIISEPILAILTLYMSLVYGILYLTFEAYPFAFQQDRRWSAGLASLPFLGLLIGILIACAGLGVFGKTWYAKRLIRTRKLNPEDRMPPMIVGAILLPVGLFWFAWTSHPGTSWVPQAISGIFIGAGIILIFMSGVVYMVDVYLVNANSAIAINTFIRSFVAAGFPMFATYMYNRLHVDWATSLLGFITVALIPFPFVFWFYGAKIRGASRFAFKIDN